MADTPEQIDSVTEARQRSRQALEDEKEALEAKYEAQKRLVDLMGEDAREALNLLNVRRQLMENAIESAKINDAEADEIANLTRLYDEFANKQDQNIERLTNQIKLQEGSKNVGKDLGQQLAGMIPIIGGNADITNSYASKLALAIEKEGGFGKILGDTVDTFMSWTTGLQGSLNVLNALKQATMLYAGAVFALSKDFNRLNAEMNKATGQQNIFGGELTSNTLGLARTGQSAEQTAASMTDLTLNMTAFTAQTTENQKQLVRTAGTLEALGVAATTTTKNFHFMTTALAMSADEADEAARKLFTAAQALNVGPGEMADEFAQSADKFAAFGKEAVDTFIDLKEISKKTGIELNGLLGIVEKFDTFDGAADTVGKLNAMLGGPFLNTIDMVSVTDPAERMLMLRDAVSDAGLAYEDMTYYQKKAIADSMQMEVSDVGALMAGDLEALGLASSESAKRIEELTNATAYTKDVGQELKALFLNVMISIEPIIRLVQGITFALNFLADGARRVTQFFTGTEGFMGAVGAMAPGFIVSTLLVRKLYTQFQKFSALLLIGFPAGARNAQASLTSLAASTAALAAAQAAASTATVGETTALTGLTAAESAAATGATALAGAQGAAATGMGSVGAVTAATATGIGAVGTSSGFAVGPTLAFGAAALMVGGGILLAGAGLALFVASFSLLSVPQMIGAAVALLALGTAIYFLLPAFTALGAFFMTPIGLALGIGLLGLAASAMMVGAAFALIGAGVGAAANGVANLVSSMTGLVGVGLSGALALSLMAEAINEIETDKAVTFSMTMRESARFIEAIAAMGTSPNQAVAFMGGGSGGGGGPTIVNVQSEIKGDMRKLFDIIDSRIEQKVNQG